MLGALAGEEAPVRKRILIPVIAAILLIAGACDAPLGDAGSAPSTSGTAAATTTSTAASLTTTTTTAAPLPLIDVGLEPPPFEEVAIATDDGVELGARLWRGTDVAILVGHDFGNTTSGAFGPRGEQSGDTVLWLSGALAREGYSVLSPDFRGHGLSEGEIDKREGSTDLRAAYRWLQEQGARKVVVVGWIGAGTVAAHLDATDDTVDFSGIMLLFSPLQEIGHDAQSVIGGLDTPTYAIGIDTGTSARFAKLLSEQAGNSLGYHVFDRFPSGLTFQDVYGAELAGRIVDFIDAVSA